MKSGKAKIEWVKRFMPVLTAIDREFSQTKPFKGVRMSITLHLEAKTAYLAQVMRNAGASVCVTGSNPLSTQDDVASALLDDNITVYAKHACTDLEYFSFLKQAADFNPHIFIDDGGDFSSLLIDSGKTAWGGTEETTTGVTRLKILEKQGKLAFPMIAANDAYCKFLFDNRYGTGQSTWDGIMRTTNLVIAGKTVVIAGYGWCGKGAALRARGLGANVIVTEVDPIKACEALFDGYRVMPMREAAKLGDIFLTVTGNINVINAPHFALMKDGALLANAGHFDVEINIPDLKACAVSTEIVRHNIRQFKMEDGRKIYLLADGRLVNLASGDGHPAEIMDLSFAVQFFSAAHILHNHKNLSNKVYMMPEEINRKIAELKLSSMSIAIDNLTAKQREYLGC